MSLFKRKPKPTPKPEADVKVFWSKTFAQSSGFKGYRQVPFSAYDPQLQDQTLTALAPKYEVSTIRLDHVEVKSHGNKFKAVDIYVNDMWLGCVYESREEAYAMLTKYNYDKAHVKLDPVHIKGYTDQVRITFLLHFIGEQPPRRVKVSTEVV